MFFCIYTETALYVSIDGTEGVFLSDESFSLSEDVTGFLFEVFRESKKRKRRKMLCL